MKALFNKLLNYQINQQRQNNSNGIFVLIGDSSIVDTCVLKNVQVACSQTFVSTSGEEVFTKEWAKNIFKEITYDNPDKAFLLSYAQYIYILHYGYSIPDFDDRICILSDNIRKKYPLMPIDYIGDNADIYPVYHAEQICEGELFYYIPVPSETVLPIFTQSYEVIEVEEPHLGGACLYYDQLEDYIQDLYKENERIGNIYIYSQENLYRYRESLSIINYVLMQLGGRIEILKPKLELHSEYEEEALNLLKRHWGDEAKFRKMKIYESPDLNNNIKTITQGHIVQILIDEYNKAKKGERPKDVFLTASTGAGKSLLFQLPAFYISNDNAVTIIISPLIALMNDQVSKIKNERGFNKVGFINSTLTYQEKQDRIFRCKRGDINLLYMSPEQFVSKDITHFIGERKLGLLVIDEAHLVTSWGKDFRTDYWNLGEKISKMKKKYDMLFPMIAVTATAVHGGPYDMVNETIDTLKMNVSVHTKFIGEIARKNIKFVLSHINVPTGKPFKQFKKTNTINFISSISDKNLKTLVYVPFAKDVENIHSYKKDDKNIEEKAVMYHGNLSSSYKLQSENLYKNNTKRVMICTKAFGMGIDIPDIQVVYHHAISGLMSDYIQEIGRAARDENSIGYAVTEFCEQSGTDDFLFDESLQRMNRITDFQLKLVLQKLYSLYKRKGHQNLLISAQDFIHIFSLEDEKDEKDEKGLAKVLRSLMLIEKNYNISYSYPPVIARNYQIMSKSYARMSINDYRRIQRHDRGRYSSAFEEIQSENNYVTVLIDLNKIWETRQTNISFEQFKYRVYNRNYLSENFAIDIRLCIKIKYSVTNREYHNLLIDFIESFKGFLLNTNNRDFVRFELETFVRDNFNKTNYIEFTTFLLQTFTNSLDNISNQRILRNTDGDNYRVSANAYIHSTMDGLIRCINGIQPETDLFPAIDQNTKYLVVGQLMELLNLGMFTTEYGDAPMVFIRLNNPRLVERDSKLDSRYKNKLLERSSMIKNASNTIMKHFFKRSMSNDERWAYIEDYFLGKTDIELAERHLGVEPQKIDIINALTSDGAEYIKFSNNSKSEEPLCLPVRNKTYYSLDILSVLVGGEYKTQSVGKWLENDIEIFYKELMSQGIRFDIEDVIKPFYSKVAKYHPDLHRKLCGLDKRYIDYKGRKLLARRLFASNPKEFYKLWKSDNSIAYLSTKDKLSLFVSVKDNGGRLDKEHKDWLENRRKS